MENAELIERIEALEKKVMRQRRIILGICLAGLSALVMAAMPQKNNIDADTVTCNELIVKNPAGQTVASMKAAKDGGGVAVFNNAGGGVVLINATAYGGSFGILNNAGQTVVDIIAGGNGGLFGIFSNAGRTVVDVMAGDNGGLLEILNKTGKTVVQAKAEDQGIGSVSVFDGEGKGRVLKPYLETGGR